MPHYPPVWLFMTYASERTPMKALFQPKFPVPFAKLASFTTLLQYTVLASQTALPLNAALELVLSNDTIAKKQPAGTFVGSLSFNDTEATPIDPAGAGQQLWKFTTNSFIQPAPAIGANGLVYVASSDSNIYAVDTSTGNNVWNYRGTDEFSATPAIAADGTVYAPSVDGSIYALDGNSGALKWSFAADGSLFSSPAIAGDGTIFFASEADTLYGLNSSDGSISLQINDAGGFQSSPAIGQDGTLYLGTSDGLKAISTQTGATLWTFASGDFVSSSPSIGADGTVYFGSEDGNVYALDGKTGTKTWEFLTGGLVTSSPAIGQDGQVYIGSDDGKLYALDGKTGTKLWEYASGDIIAGALAVAEDGTVYAGSDDSNLHALDGNDGSLLWLFSTSNIISGGAIIGEDGTVYITSWDNSLYAIKGTSPPAQSTWPMFGGNHADRKVSIDFSLVDGIGDTHNDLFTMKGNHLEVAHSLSLLDREQYLVRIQGTAPDGTEVEAAFIVKAEAVAPDAISISANTVVEGQGEWISIGNLSATDPDTGDFHTFSLEDPKTYPDNAAFRIVGDELQSNLVLDFATKSDYSPTIQVTDSYGLTFSQSISIQVLQSTPGPVSQVLIASTSIPSGSPAGQVVGNLSLSPPESPTIDPAQIGTLVWEFTGNDVFSASPSLSAAGLVYATAQDGKFYALDSQDGSQAWEFSSDVPVIASSAISNANLVYFGNQANIYSALAADTGATAWGVDMGGSQLFSTAIGVNDQLFAGADDNNIYSFDGTDGTQLWTFATGGKVTTIPAIASDGTLYAGSWDNKIYALDSTNGQKKWEFLTGGSIVTSPAIGSDGYVYVGSSDTRVYALDLQTGTKAWDFPTGDSVFSSPVVGVDGAVIFGSADTKVYAVHAQTGEKLWEFTTGAPVYSSPVVATDGSVYIGASDGKLYALDGSDGSLLWDYQTGGSIDTSPVIGPDGLVYFASADMKVYALQGSSGLANSPWPIPGGTRHRTGHAIQESFQLVAGEGDNDNSFFRIDGNQLKLDFPVYLLNRTQFSVRIEGTATDLSTVTGVLTITHPATNSPPTAIHATPQILPESSTSGEVVTILTATDEDPTDVHSFLFWDNATYPDNAAFEIENNTLKTITGLDFESQPSYTLGIQATDSTGLQYQGTIELTVSDINEAPDGLTIDNSSITENLPTGSTIGTLTPMDPDSGNIVTLTLADQLLYPGNGYFILDGNILKTTQPLDFETTPTFTLGIIGTDQSGLTNSFETEIQVEGVNEAPTSIDLDNSTITENQPSGSVVGNLIALDPEPTDAHSFTTANTNLYPDNQSFFLEGNQLKASQTFDFEAGREYRVCIQATDQGGLSTQSYFTITVTDANDSPTSIALDSATIMENQQPGTTIGTLSAIDDDAVDSWSYQLTETQTYPDNNFFQIQGDILKSTAIFDHESKPNYLVCIEVTDNSSMTAKRVVTVSVTNANEIPLGVTIDTPTISENAAESSTVGTLSTIDPDQGDSFTYALADTNTYPANAYFQLQGATLKNRQPLDFETSPNHTLGIIVTDAGGLMATLETTVFVSNSNEPPTVIILDPSSILENIPAGTPLATLSAQDPDVGDLHSFLITDTSSFPDNSRFYLSGNQLFSLDSADFETKPTYNLRFRATDSGGLAVEQDININIIDGNDPPDDILLDNNTIQENLPPRTVVGTLSPQTLEPGDSHTFAFVDTASYPDNSSFLIVGATLLSNMVYDAEAKSTYTLKIEATDILGGKLAKEIPILIASTNEPPAGYSLDRNSVPEDSLKGDAVALLSPIDPDAVGSYNFTLVNSGEYPDNLSFTIEGNELVAVEQLDFETSPSLTIFIQIEDNGGLIASAPATLQITNANDPPSGITLDTHTVPEDVVPGTFVGNLVAQDQDPDDTHTFSLMPESKYPGNALFQIQGNALETGGTLDFETASEVEVFLLATDNGGKSAVHSVTVQITDIQEPPSTIIIDWNGILENQPSGTTVGILDAQDPETEDTHSFALTDNPAFPDNASFQIQGNLLQTTIPFDFEVQTTYSIEILATDNTGLQFTGNLAIQTLDIDEPPISVAIEPTSFQMNPPQGTVLGTLKPYDPDSPEDEVVPAFYYFPRSADGPQNPFLEIEGDLVVVSSPDGLLGLDAYQIRVRANVQGGNVLEKTFTLHPQPYPPTSLSLDNYVVMENKPTGTSIGTFSSDDIDGSDPHTFLLTQSHAYPDNQNFSIQGNQLLVAMPPDFEAQESFNIHVQVTDSFGLQFNKALQLEVFDLNEPPDTLLLDNSSFRQSAALGALVGKLSFNDPDPAYSIPDAFRPFKLRWKTPANGPVLSTPAMDLLGSTVFFGSSDNNFYAMDSATGEIKWSLPTRGSVSSSPATGMGGEVYFGSWDGNVYARDGETGGEIWTFKTGGAVAASPAIGTGGTVYIGSADHYFYALDGADGSLVWRYKTEGAINCTPAISEEGLVYFGSHDNKVYALQASTGEKAWEFETGGWVRSSPALDLNGQVFIGSDDTFLYAFDAKTGEKHWEFDTGHHVSSSPVVGISRRVYISSEDGTLYALKQYTGEVSWQFQGEGSLTSPAIDQLGLVIVGSSAGTLYSVFGHTGELHKSSPLGGMSSSPVIGPDGTIYIGSGDSSLYAIHGTSPPQDSQWPMKGGNPQHTGRTFYQYKFMEGTGDADNPNFSIAGNELTLSKPLGHLGTDTFSVRIQGLAPSGQTLERAFTLSMMPDAVTGLAMEANSITGSIWHNLPWFGVFQDKGDGWVYHGTLGWIYPDNAQTNGGYWFWDNALGWIWTGEGTFPHFYSPTHGWISHNTDGKVSRQFYHWDTMEWKTW